jgi:hypothetical protein
MDGIWIPMANELLLFASSKVAAMRPPRNLLLKAWAILGWSSTTLYDDCEPHRIRTVTIIPLCV